MKPSIPFLSSSEAAKLVGVSIKALRLYEERGLITARRTEARWRMYGPDDMARLTEITALRTLGLSLAQVARVLEGDAARLDPALAAHQTTLEGKIRQLLETLGKVRNVRADLSRGQPPAAGDLARMMEPARKWGIAIDLPWPWSGEKFELNDVRSINYLIGTRGSGKTRLALRLAGALPNAAFLGLERLKDDASVARAGLDADPALKTRVNEAMTWLSGDGALVSSALIALLVGLESEGPETLVVDMIEQGLDQPTQEALISYLRQGRGSRGRPLFLITRSSAILDLASVGPDEAILLCPANHSAPTRVLPTPGAPGYEAVATCLASPEIRARLEMRSDSIDTAPRLPLWQNHASNALAI